MFLKEKLKIWFRQIGKAFRYHLIFWSIALFFYLFITGDESVFINYFGLLKVNSLYVNTIMVALYVTVLYTLLDILFSDRILSFSPFRSMVFLRSLLYFAIAFVLVFLAANKKCQYFNNYQLRYFYLLYSGFRIKQDTIFCILLPGQCSQ